MIQVPRTGRVRFVFQKPVGLASWCLEERTEILLTKGIVNPVVCSLDHMLWYEKNA